MTAKLGTTRKPLTPEQQARETRRKRATYLLAVFETTVKSEGLSPNTTFGELVEHLLAKGAYNLLVFQCKDERKLAYDPDAQLLPELKRRLELADHCIRHHQQENP